MINKDINIKVLSNSMIILDKTILGINGENLQGKIIFNFEKFIDGVAWLEIEKENGEKGYIQMTKENETYTLEIKSSLLSQAGYIYMQLRITQDENVNGIPVFKSKKFYVEVLNAINATATIEDDYPNIIDIVNNKLEADDITAGDNITIEKSGKKVIINSANSGDVSKKYVDDQDTKTLESAKQYADKQVPNVVETYVNEHKEELKGDKGDTGSQGPQGLKGDTGSAGADAKINGVNTLSIEAGTNITLEQEGNTLTINSTGGSGGTSDYTDLTNKPSINNVILSGNKTSSDLGLQPAGNYALESEIPTKTSDLTNDSGFISNTTNNLVNYTLKTNTGSLIDLEINQTTYVVTLSLKDVDGNIISTDTIDLPLENVVVSGAYDSTNQKIVLTLQSGDTVDIPVGALVSGLQSEITSQNKLASDLVDDTNSGNKFVTTSEKQTWNNKYDKPNGGIPKADLASAVQTSLDKADTALQSHQDISGKANKISVVQTSASTIEINSNTFYKFGEVTELNLTLAEITDNTIYNEYMFEFVSGATATTLTLPDTIKWLETPSIESNKIYQCSIVDNIGVLLGVSNV